MKFPIPQECPKCHTQMDVEGYVGPDDPDEIICGSCGLNICLRFDNVQFIEPNPPLEEEAPFDQMRTKILEEVIRDCQLAITHPSDWNPRISWSGLSDLDLSGETLRLLIRHHKGV